MTAGSQALIEFIAKRALPETSATFMLRWGVEYYGDLVRRGKLVPSDIFVLALLRDIYLKAIAASFSNKVSMVVGFLCGVTAVTWPFIEALLTTSLPRPLGSISQTTVFALAGVLAYHYRHYKGKQRCYEAAMRQLLFANDAAETRIRQAIETVGVVDSGFSFEWLARMGEPRSIEGLSQTSGPANPNGGGPK